MTDHTRYAKYQLDLFYRQIDEEIDDIMVTEDFARHATFLNYYLQNFPTLGDEVYRHIFKTTGMGAHYTDYTLQMATVDGDPDVEKMRSDYSAKEEVPFYCYYYRKYILKKVNALGKAGGSEELAFFVARWSKANQKKLDKQGYLFQFDSEEAATVRRIVFYLAFALEMDTQTLKSILVNCLLQQVLNPKNHKECIFWYCLEKKIPYSRMCRDYLEYYDSDRFDEEYRNTSWKGIQNKSTAQLLSEFRKILEGEEEELFRYLWRLKCTEKRIAQKQKENNSEEPDLRPLKTKTAADIYADCIYCVVEALVSERSERKPDRFPQLWQEQRKICHQRNRDPLMDRQTLKALFGDIDYTTKRIANRMNSHVSVYRAELIATQFMAFCFREPDQKKSRMARRKDFLDQVQQDLVDAGLRRIYLRAPLELFIMLCFLYEDPYCYFMASWEEALRDS